MKTYAGFKWKGYLALERHGCSNCKITGNCERLFSCAGLGDYEAAATLYQPDKYEIDNLKSIRLDTSDLVSLLEQVCAGETRICLPVKNILPGGGLSQFDQYEVHVQFQAEDGTIYTGTYGSDLYTFVGIDV